VCCDCLDQNERCRNCHEEKSGEVEQPNCETPQAARTPVQSDGLGQALVLRDAGETEIGGFGISAPADLLFVDDVQLVAQSCTWVHVEFDDQAVADFFDGQVDAGRPPEEFARIWVHTHPGTSPEPSGTDEATFARVFGRSDWAVMFIPNRSAGTRSCCRSKWPSRDFGW
jgi:proteasome lid subunit RPN8/RPN11